MATKKWKRFPYDSAAYCYAGNKLKNSWSRLHRGDCEPWPRSTAALVDAWRAFHVGDFGAAIEAGGKLGALGAVVANKACGVYATYVEPDEDRARDLLQSAVALGEHAAEELPNHANTHYTLAFVLGRLSQRISIVKALAEGHATRLRACLDRTLELEPKHADAHIALGLYHAEIIGKLGALAGGLTFGVSKDACLRHFDTALKLVPDSAIALVEYAHGLTLLDSKRHAAQANKLYTTASKLPPADAMEHLDILRARAQLQ